MSETDPNVVGIIVGNQMLSGWEEVRITRGIENVPPTFDLKLTEKYPTQPQSIVIQPSAPCRVTIGDDVIITGYVDRYTVSVTPEKHEVRITGRGMTQDLVDCSAEFQSYQTNNTKLVELATKLCQPFGINVIAPDGDSGTISQFNVILTETPFEIIERVCRFANFLAYEDTGGDLVIAKVGDQNMASGFVMPDGTGGDTGGNVQSGDVSFSMDNRYTTMSAVWLAQAFLNLPPPGEVGPETPAIPFVPGATATDSSFQPRADGSPRYRPLVIVSEQSQSLPDLAKMRIQWDNARRIGRSQQVTFLVDNWRDSAGTLWQVNALASMSAPTLKLVNQTWLIASVTFERGERGTVAEVTLMPPAAFVPAPDVLVPFDWQLNQATGGGAGNLGPVPR